MRTAKPEAAPTQGHALRAWAFWVLLTLGLWNSCSSHQEARASDALLSSGHYPLTLAFAVAALRGAGADDTDISRYRAYSNAILGRPFPSYYVRSMGGWTAPDPVGANGPDNDPTGAPTKVPERPLVPYRDFSVEYPPGFLLLVLPPGLLGLDLDGYRLVFSLSMGLLLALALLFTWHSARLLRVDPTPIVSGATLLALALGTIAVRRFDAIVSLSICLSLWGCLTRRPLVVGAALGLGISCKTVPGLVAPLLLVNWIVFRRWREITWASVGGVVAMLAASLPFGWGAGSRVLDMFRYHTDRPLEAASTGGALLSLYRIIDPKSAWTLDAYGCVNIVGPGQRILLPLSNLLPSLALVAVLFWCAKRTLAAREAPDAERVAGEVLWRATCATLALCMALGKVLSSQYLTWLLPAGVLVYVLDGQKNRTSLLLLGLAMLVTQLNQHVFCSVFGNGSPAFGLLVLVRNGLLIAWGLRTLRLRRKPLPGPDVVPLRLAAAEPIRADLLGG